MDSAPPIIPNLTSHPSIAPTSKKIESGVIVVDGSPGTRGTHVQGHLGHLGMDLAHPKPPNLTFHTLL